MVKKTIFYMLAIITFLSIVGCGPSEKAVQEEIDRRFSGNGSSATTQPPTEQTMPDYIEDIFLKYSQWSRNEDSQFTVSRFVRKENSFYCFTIQTKPADFGHDVKFYNPENNDNPQKSFSAHFKADYDMTTLRDFVAATIYAVEPEQERDSAKQMMESLISSFNGSEPSNLYIGTNYIVYIAPADIIGGYDINAVYKDEINEPVDTKLYEILDFEAIKSELNKDRLVLIEGNIIEVNEISPTAQIRIEDAEGNRYFLYCSFKNILDGPSVDEHCSFYVKLLGKSKDNEAYAFLQYYEKIQ